METQFYITLLLIGITFSFGLVNFKKLTSPFKILMILVAYALITEPLARILFYLGSENTFPLYHLNVLVYIVLNAFIYFQILSSEVKFRRWIIPISMSCFLLACANSFFNQNLNDFPTLSIAIHSFQSILLSLLLFNQMLNEPAKVNLLKQAIFWFNTGMLVFYSLNFTGFIFFDQYLEVEAVSWLLYVNWIGNLLLYSFYLIALYFNQKTADER